MDGLLLDTERVYTEVSSEILQRYGKVYDWNLKAQLMGRKEMDAAEFLVNEVDLPISAQEYLEERNKMHAQLFPFCKPLPGVVKLIKHLKQHNIPMAVCTSSHQTGYKLKTSRNQELFDLFEGNVVCGDHHEVKFGKPAPDIFNIGLSLLSNGTNVHSRNVLVFEDSPAGKIN